MRKIHLQVNRAETFEKVALLTAYHGVKTDDTALYDRVAVMEADDQWLDCAWVECCAQTSILLGEYLCAEEPPARSSTPHFHACLQMPDNWNPCLTTSLNDLVNAYFVTAITARWMAVTMPERENHYTAKACGLALHCKALLHSRTRHPRPRHYS